MNPAAAAARSATEGLRPLRTASLHDRDAPGEDRQQGSDENEALAARPLARQHAQRHPTERDRRLVRRADSRRQQQRQRQEPSGKTAHSAASRRLATTPASTAARLYLTLAMIAAVRYAL